MLPLFQIKTCLSAALRFKAFKLRALLGASVLALAACTNIPLEDVPVQDRTGTSVSALQAGNAAGGSTSGAGGGNAAGGGVAGVEVTGVNKSQPSALERVVYFDFDSFEIRSEFAPMLEANAKYLGADSRRRRARRPRIQPGPGPKACRGGAPRDGPAGHQRQPDGSGELWQGKACTGGIG